MNKPPGWGDTWCLYCGVKCGYSPEAHAVVCGHCQYIPEREESLEVAAGMRQWARPLSFWVSFFGQTPMPDDEAAEVQRAWDEQQEQIKQFNATHS